MTVDRSQNHVIWLTEMYMGDGKPDDAGWKLWHQSYPFDTYVALREWHDYKPPYFPWPNGGSNNDHNIYWTEGEGDDVVYWRAWEAEVMNVQATLAESIEEDDKHLTDVSHKMRQHIAEYQSDRNTKLGVGKSPLRNLTNDLERLINKYGGDDASKELKDFITNLQDIEVDALNLLGEDD